jgi:hypothetical protein
MADDPPELPARLPLRVECYSGYKADQRPVRILLHDQPFEVSVEDTWYSPGFTFFRILLTTGERYVLRHQEAQDVWTIAAFRAAAPHQK